MCPLEEVTCPNDYGMTLQRQYLTNHLKSKCLCRMVGCQYCHITGEYQFIEGEHKEQCHKFPVACPNKCEVGSVPRDDVEEHMKMCPLELIQCEYHVVGCEERMARKNQKKHNKEKMEEHLSFITHQLTDVQHKLASETVNSREELTTKITQTGKDLATTKQHLSGLIQRLQHTQRGFTTKQDDLTVKVEQVEKESKEQLVITKDDLTLKLQQAENGFKQQLAANKDKLNFTIQNLTATQEEARKTKDELTQQLALTKQDAKKTKDELNQKLTNTERDLNATKQQLATTCQNLAKAEKKHITLAANTDEVLAKLETKFQTKMAEIETAAQKRVTELETKLEEKNKLLEGIFFTTSDLWWMHINTTASKLSSGDQVVPVIVKMSEYTNKKRDEVIKHTDSFYTHHGGYKMYLCVCANGWIGGTATHLSVYLSLMKGPYDDQLKWPLNGHCEVKLLNQISNSEHHLGKGKYQVSGHQKITGGACMWYSERFISSEDIHKTTPTHQYLKDDSIFFQVDYKLYINI